MSRSARLLRRPLRQWLLLAEAGALLTVARCALKAVPTSRIVAWVRRPLPQAAVALPTATLEEFRWAITAFSRHAPLRLVCFPQALAMHAMLRRRHVASEILYGAARLEQKQLAAHAWLRCNGRIWLGGEVSDTFTVLDTWKPGTQSD